MSLSTPIYALPYPQETDTADVPRDVQALAQRLEAVLPNVGMPTGGGIDWYAPNPPAGYLLCDGSAISRTAYANLFAVLGTTWGAGDGINTFNLPDTRGRVLVGLASGGHPDVSALGNNDGAPLANRRSKHNHANGVTAAHNITAAPNLTLPDHAHAVNDPGHAHTVTAYRSTDPNTELLPHTNQDVNNATAVPTSASPTGLTVGNPTSHPALPGNVAIAGGVQIGGVIGPAGANPGDTPSFVVAAKAIRT